MAKWTMLVDPRAAYFPMGIRLMHSPGDHLNTHESRVHEEGEWETPRSTTISTKPCGININR